MPACNQPLDPKRIGSDVKALEEFLLRNIVGQAEAVEQIINIYQRYLVGLVAPGRPAGNFLFLGPTGSGKTRTVEVTAEALVGKPHAIIKIDCAEFQHSHEIAKLVGSPPGYLGHRETHPMLSQETINQHHTERVKLSFILFDEIEKASDALWNLLLGILDKATLTLGDNRRVDFSQSLIFMTGNIGASEMYALSGGRKMGFRAPTNDNEKGKTNEKIARAGLGAARKKFTPEFMNRLDHVVVFKPLGNEELRRILSLELGIIQQRILRSGAERAFVFTVTPAGRDFLLKEGTDERYGARHLKRSLDRFLVQPISNMLGSGQITTGDWVEIDKQPLAAGLTFQRRNSDKLDVPTMASLFTGERKC